MPNIRNQKVADLIRDELASRIRDEVDAARSALVTVTGVTLTADMGLARVRVSIFPETVDRAAILEAIRRHAWKLRRDLGRSLRLRRAPELEFRLDTSAEENDRIERLLKEESGERSGQD